MASPKRKLKEIQLDPEDEHLRPWLCLNSNDYILHTKMSVRTKVHRLITACPKGMVVDHINGDKLDNRKENLRICTMSENARNSKKHADATSSQYKGVSFAKTRGCWVAQISAYGNRITLGSYTVEVEAAKAYNKAALFYFGEFAFINKEV